ncbi:MAG: DUF2961 domain-containing protein [Kiritimatiellales bacterium]|nr:DUF2961 domain-containing protein [Kiritimatiellales bacterium]
MTTLWNELLDLPRPRRSRRISRSEGIDAGAHLDYTMPGKGCIKHWWCTYQYKSDGTVDDKALHNVRLQITFDGENTPAVDMSLGSFFGTFLGLDPVMVNAAPLTVLERNGFNCWFPMPFADGFRFRFINENPNGISFWFMADVHLYDEQDALTPLRFGATYRMLDPAPDYGLMDVGELEGAGFVAALFHGTDARSRTDAWYHTGGDTWLIDGESEPGIIRGNGGEDVVGYSFGIYKGNHAWQGAPYIEDESGVGGSFTPCIFYRFFGPDAIVFKDSLIAKFGTKAARVETTLYHYRDGQPARKPTSIRQWYLCGPFDGHTFEAFDREEFPETEEPSDRTFATDLPPWQPNPKRPPEDRPPQYVGRWEKTDSRRGWVDFLDVYRGIGYANGSAAGFGGAAYALGNLESTSERDAVLRLAFDDWLKVWVNGKLVATLRHEDGFNIASVPVRLRQGENHILLKLSNSMNREFGAWAFNLAIESPDSQS